MTRILSCTNLRMLYSVHVENIYHQYSIVTDELTGDNIAIFHVSTGHQFIDEYQRAEKKASIFHHKYGLLECFHRIQKPHQYEMHKFMDENPELFI